MFDFNRAYNDFKDMDKREKIKKLNWILDTLKDDLITYEDMYHYLQNSPDIEDNTLLNYYEIILNDLIKMEEINTKKESKSKLKKLIFDIDLERKETKDHQYANNLLKNI